METDLIFYLVPASSLLALFFAFYFFRQMIRQSEGTVRMREVALYVRNGAMAYLKQQYKVVGIVFLVLLIFFVILAYGFGVQNKWVPFAFLTGGFFSGLAGFIGMKTATYASARTACAAEKSLNSGLKVAFRSGAVMGLVVVGLGLLDISIWYLVLNHFIDVTGAQKLTVITTTMLTFGMGASTQALFARVGGGIYTKAADVGADLVGKVEAGIPEDDPRNPATIADNVGDNVGDVAGMGADLYESYCGSILATAALGAAAFYGDTQMQLKGVFAPMLIAAIGIILSLIGIFLVRTKENAGMRQLLKSLGFGVNFSSLLIILATFAILRILEIPNWVGISCSVITGLVAGIIIGQSTEYYTSHSYKPTRKIAGSSETGPATVIISGIGTGLISTAIPVVTVSAAVIIAYMSAIGFDVKNMLSGPNLSMGLYGQCRRKCADEQSRCESQRKDRHAGCVRQYYGGYRKRIRNRFGSPYCPGIVGIVYRRDKDSPRKGGGAYIGNCRKGCRCSIGWHTRLYGILSGKSDEPQCPGRSVHRCNDVVSLLRAYHECGRPCGPEDGGGGAPSVP